MREAMTINRMLRTILLAGVLATSAVATESVVSTNGTTTLSAPTEDNGVRKVTINWTSDASGDVSSSIKNVYGTLRRVVFAPVASASPTASYDIVINDITGVDVLEGAGANLSATAATDAVPLVATTVQSGTAYEGTKVVVAGNLDLAITNAGASKQGLLTLYVSKNISGN